MTAHGDDGSRRGSGRITSHDVALEAGVSQATVARAYSNPDKVAADTAARVRAAAERLGYVPNAIARSLKAQQTDIIGAVVPASGEYWQHVVTAFSRQLTNRSRQLLLFSFSEVDQIEQVLETVARYRVDGIIAASANISNAHLARIERLGMPVVAFNQPNAAGLLNSVAVDNELGMATLADHVVERGARTALFVGGIAHTSTDQSRYRGAAAKLATHGVPCAYLEAGAFTWESGYKTAGAIAELAATDELPDALMVASDEVAFGVIDGLRERGIDAPRDVLITGFDGLPQSRWAGYDLTTLEQPTELLVTNAIAHLLDGDESAKNVIVAGTLRLGRTTDRETYT